MKMNLVNTITDEVVATGFSANRMENELYDKYLEVVTTARTQLDKCTALRKAASLARHNRGWSYMHCGPDTLAIPEDDVLAAAEAEFDRLDKLSDEAYLAWVVEHNKLVTA